MSNLDDFIKAIAEGKQATIDNNPGLKALKELQESLRNTNPFASPVKEEVEPESVVLSEDVVHQPIEEPIVADPLAEVVQYLNKEAMSGFQQPNPDKVDPTFKAMQDKLKFLEQWIGKISAHGPGSGEVNLRWLDDVDRSTIQDGYFLKFNATKNKFDFVEVKAETALQDTGEPMGHQNKLESQISFNNTSRVFTISPVSASYVIYTKGTRRTITDTRTVTIPNTTGLYYIYFDVNGVLQYRTSYFDWPNDCMTAYVYWNADTQSAPLLADERHGIVLDWQTHEYLHRTRGAAYATGFVASNYVLLGDGSSSTHMQFDLAGGTFFDEDLQVDIVHSNTPSPNTWEQDLQGPARIPVFYLSGQAWVLDAPTNFPIKQGSVLPVANIYNGSAWITQDIDNNKFGLTFIVATNNINYPVIGIIGQSTHANQADAEATDFNELNLTGFPVFEFRPLYKLIYECKASYTNTPKARLTLVTDLRKVQAV